MTYLPAFAIVSYHKIVLVWLQDARVHEKMLCENQSFTIQDKERVSGELYVYAWPI